jgi:hypothetical protein
MSKMNAIIKDFVYKVSLKRNLPEAIAAEVHFYRLLYDLGWWKDIYLWIISPGSSRNGSWYVSFALTI